MKLFSRCLQGVKKKFNADFSIAVSGVAGPSGGTPSKPVGTVVIGVLLKNINENTPNKEIENIQVYNFKGDRKEIQIQAAKTALKRIFEICCKNY